MNLREQMQTRLENRCAMEPDNHIKNGRSDSCSCPNDRITAYTMRNTRRDAINRVSTNRQIYGSNLPSFGGAGGGVFGGAGGGVLLVLFMAIATLSNAQGNSGWGFNYQAVVRGVDGFLIKNQQVELEISLRPGQGSQDVWIETHSGPDVYADAYGTVSIIVGQGVRQAGSTVSEFKNINFALDRYWMKVRIRPLGGNYSILQDTALPSMPYAEVADNARSAEAVIQAIEEKIEQALDENQIAFNVLMANTQNALAELNILLENSQNALAQLNDALAQVEAKTVPVGTIVPFAGPADKVPDGWELCDGGVRDGNNPKYAALFEKIGWAWGRGDWTGNSFNLPDLRGLFLRGAVNDAPLEWQRDPDVNHRGPVNAGGNSGNDVGSYQDDAIRNIKGNLLAFNVAGGAFLSSHLYGGTPNGSYSHVAFINFDANAGSGSNPMAGYANGGDIRPKNVYVNYIIKY